MKKIALVLALLASCIGLHAQEYYINLHQSGQIIYQNNVNEVNNLYFQGSSPASLFINNYLGTSSFPVTAFDSITFVYQEAPQLGDTVFINYNGSTATVINPYPSWEVAVTINGAKVSITAMTASSITYCLSGTSEPGRFEIESSTTPTILLNDVHLNNLTGKAMDLTCNAGIILKIADGTENTLNNAGSDDPKSALTSNNNLLVQGNGTLTVGSTSQHAIKVKGLLTMNSGTINTQSLKDGIHTENFIMHGGNIEVIFCGDDGIACEYDGTINGGNITITTPTDDINALSVDSTLVINGGEININISGGYAKCIKADKELTINGGTFVLNHSGDVSKGLKSNGDITITDGDFTIVSSGTTVLEESEKGRVPAYCTAIKGDTDINISGGTFNINLPTSNQGGKSISADGNLFISGGDFTIETHGNGAAYTISGNTKDSYTSSCLKSDGNMEILAGTFNLTSTGTGGKGINAGGTMKIGMENASNDDLILNVTTTGERITVTAGGGGPWGGGGDYANPKAVKSQGNLTINSGTIHVECLQTQNEGGECIESKAILTINGGDIEAYSKKDDAVNASSRLIINGGTYYAHSDANDGTDCNGPMELNGGFLISNGAASPEEGFDCDNNQFKITGGTIIGTGGGTSTPTSSVCTQPTLRINTQPGYAIQVLKSDNTVICTYQCPTFTGGGGGWPGPGGGNNSMVMLFTSPLLQTGQTYTVKYNGTISGGTNTNGYYTGNVTYTGGSTATVTLNSMYGSVNAGSSGGGW